MSGLAAASEGCKGKPPKRDTSGAKSKSSNWAGVCDVGNVISASAPGVHMWHGDPSGASWMIGRPERFRKSNFAFAGADIPDLSLDPADNLLTAINPSTRARSFHVTIENRVIGKSGHPLTMGSTRSEDGIQAPCVALVLLVPPQTTVDLCRVDTKGSGSSTPKVFSDIVNWKRHPSPDDMSLSYCMDSFPLRGSGPFLVSQGSGGGLTHFSHPSTFHAIDFECPVGTPVLAVGDGVVVDVRQHSKCTGIKVSNLFQWNSITLRVANSQPSSFSLSDAGKDKLEDASGEEGDEEEEDEWEDLDEEESAEEEAAADDGNEPLASSVEVVYVEYVHIQAHSALVAVGDAVKSGQVLCLSGDAGFCPVPHLHLEAHASKEPGAPSIPICLKDRLSGSFVVPKAGEWHAGGGSTPRELLPASDPASKSVSEPSPGPASGLRPPNGSSTGADQGSC